MATVTVGGVVVVEVEVTVTFLREVVASIAIVEGAGVVELEISDFSDPLTPFWVSSVEGDAVTAPVDCSGVFEEGAGVVVVGASVVFTVVGKVERRLNMEEGGAGGRTLLGDFALLLLFEVWICCWAFFRLVSFASEDLDSSSASFSHSVSILARVIKQRNSDSSEPSAQCFLTSQI